MSKTLDVLTGITLSSLLIYVLSLYISWIPDFDIYMFAIVVGLNLLQCLPNPATTS
jgi:hypothetical protein